MQTKIYQGTYLQAKVFTMLLDWSTVEGIVKISYDPENDTVTLDYKQEEAVTEADSIWTDVVSTMNVFVEGAIATHYAREHKWIE